MSPETLNPKLNGQNSPEKLHLPEKRKKEEPEAETSTQQKQQNPLWKTSLCAYFRRNYGSCSHGDACRYAHSEKELRIRPDNTWDPTSQRAKKMAKEKHDKCDDVTMRDALDDPDSGLSKCLLNLPMEWSSDDLRCFLIRHGVTFKSAEMKEVMPVGFVTFKNAEQVKTAEKELDRLLVRNKIIRVGDVIPQSFERKGNSARSSFATNQQVEKQTQAGDGLDVTKILDETEAEDQVTSDLVVKSRCIRDVVTPLAKMPYVDQLEQKKNSLIQTLRRLTRNAR